LSQPFLAHQSLLIGLLKDLVDPGLLEGAGEDPGVVMEEEGVVHHLAVGLLSDIVLRVVGHEAGVVAVLLVAVAALVQAPHVDRQLVDIM